MTVRFEIEYSDASAVDPANKSAEIIVLLTKVWELTNGDEGEGEKIFNECLDKLMLLSQRLYGPAEVWVKSSLYAKEKSEETPAEDDSGTNTEGGKGRQNLFTADI